MKPKVFVTRRIPDAGLSIVREHCEITLNEEERSLTTREIIEGVKSKDGLLCLLTDAISADVMDASQNLKVISNYAVGYNNIDVEGATKRGIMVTNTPGVLTETTADLAWALLMDAARRIAEGDRFTRAGKFKGWEPMLLLGQDVYRATLGIVGFGRIGQAVARRALGFNMKVLYHQRNRASVEVEKQLNAAYASFEELLKTSDFISLHCPLTLETTHLMGDKEFNMMKNNAILINTARGPVVDEAALVRALKDRRIAGAGLDVYEREPELAPGLAELDNVVIPPHLGSASFQTRNKMAQMAAENLVAALSGKVPPNLVNQDALTQKND